MTIGQLLMHPLGVARFAGCRVQSVRGHSIELAVLAFENGRILMPVAEATTLPPAPDGSSVAMLFGNTAAPRKADMPTISARPRRLGQPVIATRSKP